MAVSVPKGAVIVRQCEIRRVFCDLYLFFFTYLRLWGLADTVYRLGAIVISMKQLHLVCDLDVVNAVISKYKCPKN
jgi:hypothetical protein